MSGGLGHITSQFALVAGETALITQGKLEEPDHSSCNWYFSREEIEKHSTSRKDGIDIKKEIYFRKSYCTFLQDLGMRLKVPQVTIATAIVFCHRFFLRQSHAKNDRHLVATVCMFLAGKVEETPRPLRDVILISYEIRNKKDPAAVQRIRQKDVYEEQKDLVLTGERLVLATLGFDLNIHHPYKPLVTAIKKYKVAQHALAQVAWNFVNDGLRTSLCLQFKPHHIAAGAIFLAAKFLKVKLPSDGDKVWWQEFEVTPRQLEEVSNQMLELYEQNKVGTGSRTSDLNGSAGTSVYEKPGVVTTRHANVATPSEKGQLSPEENATATQSDRSLHLPDAKVAATSSCEHDISNPTRTATNVVGHASDSTSDFQQKISEIKSDYSRPEGTTWATNSKTDDVEEGAPTLKSDTMEEAECNAFPLKADDVQQQTKAETQVVSDDRVGGESEVGQCGASDLRVDDGTNSMVVEPDNLKPLAVESYSESKSECNAPGEIVKPEPQVGEQKKHYAALDEVNKDRVKAALEKRRKSRGDGAETRTLASKLDFNDEDELLERELESGVEAAVEAERVKQDQSERKYSSHSDRDMEVVEAEKVSQEDSQVSFQPESSEVPAEVDKMKQDGKDRKDEPQQESGVEAAAETDTMTQSRKDNKTTNTHRSSSDPFDGKKERSYEPEGSLKRKRPKDEILPTSDRKWPRFLDRTDWSGDSDRARPKERTEGGESRNGHEQVHSPRSDSRFQQLQSVDRSTSPSKQRDHASHGQHGRRDGVQENKHRHGYSRDHYNHHSHHYQQHRLDTDRDRYHHKERDWQEREQKKARHGYGK